MITGFNTDVKHGGLVFHVQTEDNGVANPLIESIVYVSGMVMGSKRSSYRHLVEQGKGKREIGEMMERQHRIMIAAVQRGMYDDKAGLDPATTASEEPEEPSAPVPVAASTVVTPPPSEPEEVPIAPPTASGEPDRPQSATPTLDQIILDYLSAEASQEQLVLSVDTIGELERGSQVLLSLKTSSSRTDKPVGSADVRIDLITTVSDSIRLAEGQTNPEGILKVNLEIPDLAPGTCALIVRAASPIGNAEIKQLF